MEYVDGEDLASLLRRIGKLPREKALDVARKSDTPRRAGGLMNWAASKAVGPLV